MSRGKRAKFQNDNEADKEAWGISLVCNGTAVTAGAVYLCKVRLIRRLVENA